MHLSAEASREGLALAALIDSVPDIAAHVLFGQDGPLLGVMRDRGISAEVLPLPRRKGAAPAATVPYVLRLARRLEHLRPYVVHTNSASSALYGGIAARLAEVPLVWHLRDEDRAAGVNALARGPLRRLVPRLPHAVIATSVDAAALARYARRCVVIPGPVFATAPLPASKYRSSRNRPLQFGMRCATEGARREALASFERAFPNRSHEADVVLAADLPVARLPQWLSDVDVVVDLTHEKDAHDDLILAAMASGRTVVATSPGPGADLVTDGIDGLLVPCDRPDLLTSALRLVAHQPKLRARLADGARATSAPMLADVVGPRIREIYDDVVATSLIQKG